MKKQKPWYRKVRLPQIRQTGGPQKLIKGGPHDRNKEKEKARREIKAELN